MLNLTQVVLLFPSTKNKQIEVFVGRQSNIALFLEENVVFFVSFENE